MKELGYELEEDTFEEVFNRFKELADKKKKLSSVDIEALINNEIYSVKPIMSWNMFVLVPVIQCCLLLPLN